MRCKCGANAVQEIYKIDTMRLENNFGHAKWNAKGLW